MLLEIEPFHQAKYLRLWWGALSTWILLKLMVEWVWVFFFLENSTSWAGLLGSGLKSIFQLLAHLEISNRSLLRVLALSFLSLAIVKSYLCYPCWLWKGKSDRRILDNFEIWKNFSKGSLRGLCLCIGK